LTTADHLRRELHTAEDEITSLEEENDELRREIRETRKLVTSKAGRAKLNAMDAKKTTP
jgi:predicted  nucleic acid-binding Zn-ribbon protein